MTFTEVETELGELLARSGDPIIKLLNRYHLNSLREEGYSEVEVTDWLRKLLGPKQSGKVIADLFSYGEWSK